MEQTQTYNTGAKRNNLAKLRYDLVPVEAYECVAKGLTYGANKYGDDNWRKGLPATSTYASCMRHMLAWFNGEDIDKESGLHHIELAMTNLSMLAWTLNNLPDMDNRYNKKNNVDN